MEVQNNQIDLNGMSEVEMKLRKLESWSSNIYINKY